jgi:hypothetical protein
MLLTASPFSFCICYIINPPVCFTLLLTVASKGAAYLASPAVTAAHASELSAAGGIVTAQDLAVAAPQERELLKMQVNMQGTDSGIPNGFVAS